MPAPPDAYVSWSSGKDCAFALVEARRLGLANIVGILTTVNEVYDRVAMHGVRSSVLDRQAEALGLPCLKIPMPYPCSNAVYEERMGAAVASIRSRGVRHVVFGDLFLEDIRAYREEKMAAAGMQPLFPLWLRPTAALAEEMLAAGLVAHIACLDPRHLGAGFAGRTWDGALLAELPASCDPCGERGEFHTVVSAGPMFDRALELKAGPTVMREGFVFTDFE